jgi:hypothetical protein
VGTLQTLVTPPAAQIENVNRLSVSGLCAPCSDARTTQSVRTVAVGTQWTPHRAQRTEHARKGRRCELQLRAHVRSLMLDATHCRRCARSCRKHGRGGIAQAHVADHRKYMHGNTNDLHTYTRETRNERPHNRQSSTKRTPNITRSLAKDGTHNNRNPTKSCSTTEQRAPSTRHQRRKRRRVGGRTSSASEAPLARSDSGLSEESITTVRDLGACD